MSYTHVHARRSGRSTRMLERAFVATHANNYRPLVLCVDSAAVDYLKGLYVKVCERNGYAIARFPRFETLDSCRRKNIDYMRLCNTWVEGEKGENNLFIDHHVYEHLFGNIINGYHAYDGHVPA